ncbi:MAG: hypothetical protein R3F30_09390 [Planctomycetota bacterium]
MNDDERAPEDHAVPTHRDLMPPDLCVRLMFKQVLTHALDDEVRDGRTEPGDGYYWCQETCTDVGPDDELVEPRACRSGRSCCESLES